MPESSTKPYLVRAIHEWCQDQGYTPYISVAVDERTIVPRGFVKAGEIVLNISVMATNRLKISNDFVEFQARFGGVAHDLSVPMENVSAIYARETGHGMAFDVTKPPAVLSNGIDSKTASASDASAGDKELLAQMPTLTSAKVTPLLRSVQVTDPLQQADPITENIQVAKDDDSATAPEPDPNKPLRPRLTRVK